MRRWIALGAVAAGVVILCVPYRYRVPFQLSEGRAKGAVAHCVPIRDVSKERPDGAWVGYGPGTEIELPSNMCEPTARRRVAIAGVPLLGGVALFAWDRRGRSRKPPPD